MTNIELVRDVFSRWSAPRAEGEWVVVPTSLAYPSNRTVQVYLHGGQDTVRAFDGGGAFDELDGGGEYEFDAFKVLERFAKKAGVQVDKRGWLASEPVTYADLPSLVPYLANVSVEASIFLHARRRKKKLVDLREEVNRILVQRYDDAVTRHKPLLGASNKVHRFDFIVEASKTQRLAIDAALPDASSINAIVVRQLDVRAAKPEGVSQMIVYDDRDKWKSEDIALLRTGGRPYAFTHLPEVLARSSHHW
jgi:hypothetical protein